MNYLEKFKLKKKLVFVVGGLGVIGQEIVKALSDAGARVAFTSRNDSSIKKSLSKLNNKKKNFHRGYLIDLSKKNYTN